MNTAYSYVPAPVRDWDEETEKYLDASNQLVITDIDWDLAAKHGVTDEEVFMLTYFSDIEHQTIVYMRDLLNTDVGLEPDVVAFLTMWNYEEFFHGRALAKLLEVCGRGLEKKRVKHVRRRVELSERLESIGAAALSKIFRGEFPAVHATWGATQEATTLHGYESLKDSTNNPVLKTLCERISKQERRHYAWYFNKAKDRLAASTRAQKLTRTLMEKFWSPVGAGVKTDDEVRRLVFSLFGSDGALEIARDIDAKIGSLPGLGGIRLMVPYVSRAITR